MSQDTSTQIVKTYCDDCKQKTNHEILREYQKNYGNEEYDFYSATTYQIICCCGCETTSFRTESWCSENYPGEVSENRYLKPFNAYELSTTDRRSEMDTDYFPKKVRTIYEESITAINSGITILSAIGMRTIVESICLEQKTNTKTLEAGINALVKKGLISSQQADFLHKHRFMGNEAAHEIESPNHKVLNAAFEIIETLLKTIYILPELADKMPSKETKKT